MLYYFLFAAALLVAIVLYRRFLAPPPKRYAVYGSVMVVGADSGMGECSVYHLAALGYTVFAGIYVAKSAELITARAEKRAKRAKENSLEASLLERIHFVPIDVSDNTSVLQAAATVRSAIAEKKLPGLIALVNCSGVAFFAPAEYIPLDRFERNLKVNLVGYVATTQAFLPLIKETCMVSKPSGGYNLRRDLPGGGRRGRVIYIGTGGGVPASCPAMLSAYMASKWGGEAFQQSLRLEMRLSGQPIDPIMVNPGYVKPSGLYAQALTALEETYKQMPPQAKVDYGQRTSNFVSYSTRHPGTHRSAVASAIYDAISLETPPMRFRVGNDSKMSPIVAMGPQFINDFFIESVAFGNGWPSETALKLSMLEKREEHPEDDD